MSNLRFVKDDAWQAELLGQFDCVFCGGLLYHIDRVAAFADLLASLTNQLLIVNTHFAVESGPQQHRLDPITEHDGYRGRWYTEFPDETTFADREQYHLSSWDNRRSFWLLRDEIPELLLDVGFDSVDEEPGRHRIARDVFAHHETLFAATRIGDEDSGLALGARLVQFGQKFEAHQSTFSK